MPSSRCRHGPDKTCRCRRFELYWQKISKLNMFSFFVVLSCLEMRYSTKLFSLKYTEDYWKLSWLVASSVHTSDTVLFCPCRRCELGIIPQQFFSVLLYKMSHRRHVENVTDVRHKMMDWWYCKMGLLTVIEVLMSQKLYNDWTREGRIFHICGCFWPSTLVTRHKLTAASTNAVSLRPA